MNSDELRERLRKIHSLFTGSDNPGERAAAAAAMDRLQARIDEGAKTDQKEYQFSLHNPWSKKLFMALCRSRGYRPYRYPRMRHTTLCLMIEQSVLDETLWPEFVEMNQVLTDYLNEIADRIIHDCVHGDTHDAEVRPALDG